MKLKKWHGQGVCRQLFNWFIPIAFILILFACEKKSLVIEDHKNIDFTQLKQYDWSSQESAFFQIKKSITSRSIKIQQFNPELVDFYNQIAIENEEHNFIESAATALGFPFWDKSFIYKTENESLIILPLSNEKTRPSNIRSSTV